MQYNLFFQYDFDTETAGGQRPLSAGHIPKATKNSFRKSFRASLESIEGKFNFLTQRYISVILFLTDENLITPNTGRRLAHGTKNSFRSFRSEHSLENSEIMTDYAVVSAASQDNTIANNSPLSSEDEQNTDFALNEFKQGNSITIYTF